jgi:hypothetical protein
MKKLMLGFLVALFMVLGVINANAQAISNDVRVSAGVVSVEDQTLFTGSAEVRKSFNERFGLVNTLSTVTDGDFTLVENRAVIRFAPTDNFFVAGGINVGKLQGSDPFVNPTIQAGANFNLGSRINLEPFVQLETPDLASDNPQRTLSGNLTAKLRITNSFGLVGNGSLRATRTTNEFFEGGTTKVVSGGVYFTF